MPPKLQNCENGVDGLVLELLLTAKPRRPLDLAQGFVGAPSDPRWEDLERYGDMTKQLCEALAVNEPSRA